MLTAMLGKIFMQILGNILGYNFITEVLVIGAKQWADSTASKNDDKVVLALARALGKDPALLKD